MGVSPLYWCTGRIAGKCPKNPFSRIVKIDEEKPTEKVPHNLFHSEDKNTDNDLIDIQKQDEPGKMEKSDLETEPAANTDYDELRAEVPVLPHDTESKSAIDNHSVPENSNTSKAQIGNFSSSRAEIYHGIIIPPKN